MLRPGNLIAEVRGREERELKRGLVNELEKDLKAMSFFLISTNGSALLRHVFRFFHVPKPFAGAAGSTSAGIEIGIYVCW